MPTPRQRGVAKPPRQTWITCSFGMLAFAWDGERDMRMLLDFARDEPWRIAVDPKRFRRRPAL